MARFASLLASVLLAHRIRRGRQEGCPLVPVGSPLAPAAPHPLPPDHLLHHAVALLPVADLPGKAAGAKQAAFDAALAEMLSRLGMLAPPGGKARFRSAVRWTGLESPFRIAFSAMPARGWAGG